MEKREFESTLFEGRAGNVEKDRSRLIIIISGIAVFAIVGLIVLQQMFGGGSARAEMSRSGSSEFDSYKDLVVILSKDMKTGERLTGAKFGQIKCRIQNTGDRTLVGLELHAAAVDYQNVEYPQRELAGRKDEQGKPVIVPGKDVTVIPSELTGRDELGPGEAMDVEINLEPIPDRSQLTDMIVVVNGLRLK
jgi:hypothetical protein